MRQLPAVQFPRGTTQIFILPQLLVYCSTSVGLLIGEELDHNKHVTSKEICFEYRTAGISSPWSRLNPGTCLAA
ncbi:hypothetical protein Hypma_011161 [Hypsizygus marmoreus]|uniref:Uncharacterized protein n=1 Tax=Hypsizygus marmoreus TaxID=39966 RepID=A0A369JIQ6_HYPMA|nr:hypothetical protein Hypma_011161 [Hypsizygus marmoreus]